MNHALLWSHNKRFGMTMYSNNTAKSVWAKVSLSFLSHFSSQIIFFPSTVPPVPSFFCLLFLIPSPLISISHPILNSFLRPLFILSIMRFSSLGSHSFSAYSFLLYFTIYSLYGCLSSFLASYLPFILPFVTILTFCCVFVSRYFLHSITIPFFLSFLPSFFSFLSLSFLCFLCLYLSLFFLAFL